MTLSDVNVLIDQNIKKNIEIFLSTYLVNFVSTENFYEYPKYRTPVIYESENFRDMLNYVLENNGDYTFYFKNKDQGLKFKEATIKINKDNSLILSLSTQAEYEEITKESLSNVFSTKYVFITNDIPPLESKEDILQYFPRSAKSPDFEE